MNYQAARIELSKRQQEILEKMERGTHIPLHLIERSRIILMASEGMNNSEIARQCHLNRNTVKKWRNRWFEVAIERNTTEKERPYELKRQIESSLSDEKRAGRPCTFTADQVAQIISLACQSPKNKNLPFSHWTSELLARQAIEEGIVENISSRTIQRFLKRKRLKTSPM